MQKYIAKVGAILVVLSLMLSACAAPGTPGGAATSAPTTAAATQAPATAAAQPTDPPAAGAVEIRWFVGLGTGTDPAQVEIENKVVEEFNKTHPNIKLVLEVVNYDTSRDTLATEIASGNPPDIVGPVGTSGAEAFHGLWLDLAPLIEKHNYDLSQFDQGAVDFYQVGGEGQVGIPFAIFPSMVFYQREMFDEAGLAYPPHKYGEKYTMPDGTEVEWSFDTLREIALLLTVDANGKDATDPDFDPTKIVQYGYVPQYQDLRAMGSYFGADTFVAEDGKTAQIPPQWAEAWKWIYEGIWTDHFIPNQSVIDSAEFASGNPFNSGKVAMGISHLWYTCCISDAGENWDIAAVPSHNGKITSNFNADTFRILKDSKHPDEAFEVLTYLLGEASLELLGIYGGLPARGSDRAAFYEAKEEQFPQGVDWAVVDEGIAYADNPSFEGYMPNYNESFDRANAFQSLLFTTEGLDLDKEIETFKNELQAIFDK